MKTTYSFLFLLLSFGTGLAAQPLDSLLEIIPFENLRQRALRTQFEAGRERSLQVGRLKDPEVGIGIYLSPLETLLGGQQGRFSVSQELPWPRTLVAQRELGASRVELAREEVAADLLDAQFQLKVAYLQLYEYRHLATLTERKDRLLARLEQEALERVESGEEKGIDVLRLQIQREELQQELRILNSAEITPLVTINLLLNRPPASDIVTSDTLTFAPLRVDLADAFAELPEKHPALRSYAQRRKVAESQLAVNILEGKPNITLGLDYLPVSERTDFNPVNNGRDIVQFRAGFSLPLYRSKYRAREREDRLRIEALDVETQSTTDRLAGAITTALARHDRARLRLERCERQLRLARAARDLLVAEYQETGARFSELLRLDEETLLYEQKALAAIVESHLAKAEVERYLLP